MRTKAARYELALTLLADRFARIKPPSRTALYINSVLGFENGTVKKRCKACGHLQNMHSNAYEYCVHPLPSTDLCKCIGVSK